MAKSIVPLARGLYLCDYHVGYETGKVDLYGIFTSIRPEAYPHVQERFCIFVQLVGGLGRVPFFVDIRNAARDQLIHTTSRNVLDFPERTTVVQVALVIEGCRFSEPGIHLVELFCDNSWVCDAILLLSPAKGQSQ